MIIYDYIWLYMIIYDYIWLYMIIYDYIWLYMIIYDYIWLYMIIYDYIWLYMIIYDYMVRLSLCILSPAWLNKLGNLKCNCSQRLTGVSRVIQLLSWHGRWKPKHTAPMFGLEILAEPAPLMWRMRKPGRLILGRISQANLKEWNAMHEICKLSWRTVTRI